MNGKVGDIMDRYQEAWNRHDVESILALHTDDTVFQNHTSGGLAVGKEELRNMLQSIFATLPDLRFDTRRAYFRDDVAVVEWTATATHAHEFTRGALTVPPSGKKMSWNGMDIIPMRDGLVARKDVYADSMSFLKQLGVPLP